MLLQYEPPGAGRSSAAPYAKNAMFLRVSSDSATFLLFVFFCWEFDGHDVFGDVHMLDLAPAAYLPQITNFSIDVAVLSPLLALLPFSSIGCPILSPSYPLPRNGPEPSTV
ncbi:hypothetical protein BGW80DRAFT_132217 [Lactifluus volemus]|nr:hypothetical protein BGW80DRAFT_132217 [Lactifluus volemus]